MIETIISWIAVIALYILHFKHMRAYHRDILQPGNQPDEMFREEN